MPEPLASILGRLSLREWADSVFDCPVRKRSWWWDDDAILPFSAAAHPREAMRLLTTTLETPSVFEPYSEPQIAEGLWFLFDSSCSDYTTVLREPSLPTSARVRCIEAIFTLTRDLFAARCPAHPSGSAESPLSTTCNMLWDVSDALAPHSTDAVGDEACLSTLSRILTIPHAVCQRSALHGLGHWAKAHRPTDEIVDRFLEANPNIDPEMRSYALKARAGKIQ